MLISLRRSTDEHPETQRGDVIATEPPSELRWPLTHLLRLEASKTGSEWQRKMAGSGHWLYLGTRVF